MLDTTTLRTDISALTPATEALLTTATRLSDAELGEASLCAGWTRGHVLAHVARNADALARLASWALTGVPTEMYPGGEGARDREIEDGAGRSPAQHLEDLQESHERLVAGLAGLAAGEAAQESVEARRGFTVRADALPFMRLREVAFHNVDLDAGFSFADLSPELTRRFVDDAVSRLQLSSRAPALSLRSAEGDAWTVEPGEATEHRSPTAVTGTRAGILLWLARRVGDGVTADGPLPALPRGA
jgi:maleylpyruvate isomerase